MVPVTFPLQNSYRYPRENDIKSTVAGIYALRQLQFKRSGRLDLKAVLALDCCSIAIGSDSDRCDSSMSELYTYHPKPVFKTIIHTGVTVLA